MEEFTLCFWSAQLFAIAVNVYFIWELTNRRHSQENRCFFLYHSMTLAFTNCLTLLYNFALSSYNEDERSLAVGTKEGLSGRLVWAVGVYLCLTQQLATLVLSLSRMVAMTFKWHMQTYVWESRVSNFAIAAQFLFPLMLIVCFLIDSPIPTSPSESTSSNITKVAEDVHAAYVDTRRQIYGISFGVCFFAHFVILARRLYLNVKRARLEEARVRRRERGEDSDDSNTTITAALSIDIPRTVFFAIPHTPTVQPTFAAREFHFSLLVFLQVIAQLYHWRTNEALPSGDHASLVASAIVSSCLPLTLSIYWLLPHVAFYLKYKRCCCAKSAVFEEAMRAIHLSSTSSVRPVSTTDINASIAEMTSAASVPPRNELTIASIFQPRDKRKTKEEVERMAVTNRASGTPWGRIYPALMLFLTQVAYLPIASTMLATSFFEPSNEECNWLLGNNSSTPPSFHSLFIEWGVACQDSVLLTVISFTIMFGGVVGAFIAGFLADRFGRKPVVVGTLTLVTCGNLIIWAIAAEGWVITTGMFFISGAAAGGYMVTNFVLLVETVSKSRMRVLMVSVNGWSLSVSGTALLAFLAAQWRSYHLVTAFIAALFAFLLQVCACESASWQETANRGMRNKSDELVDGDESDKERAKKYSYLDLLKLRSLRGSLLALVYCFTVSSIVSFGLYMNVEKIPGGRYLNLGLMGVGKFALGFLPWLLSRWVGRRPIQIVSVSVACIAAWALVVSILLEETEDTLFSVLSLIVTTSLDPSWKMQHLYSAELFPTVVRNMARGVCNVGARFGGVVAPLIVRLRSTNWIIPYVVFAVLLSMQLVVSHFYLPETCNRPLRDIPAEEDHDSQIYKISNVPKARNSSEQG